MRASTEGTEKPIIVRIHMSEYSNPLTFGSWAQYLEGRFRQAGIPVSGDGVSHGTLNRYDDPNDFGVTVYEWKP